MTFDWNAEPRRPLSTEDVWQLMVNGCNWHEITVAAHVDAITARGMMARASQAQVERRILGIPRR